MAPKSRSGPRWPFSGWKYHPENLPPRMQEIIFSISIMLPQLTDDGILRLEVVNIDGPGKHFVRRSKNSKKMEYTMELVVPFTPSQFLRIVEDLYYIKTLRQPAWFDKRFDGLWKAFTDECRLPEEGRANLEEQDHYDVMLNLLCIWGLTWQIWKPDEPKAELFFDPEPDDISGEKAKVILAEAVPLIALAMMSLDIFMGVCPPELRYEFFPKDKDKDSAKETEDPVAEESQPPSSRKKKKKKKKKNTSVSAEKEEVEHEQGPDAVHSKSPEEDNSKTNTSKSQKDPPEKPGAPKSTEQRPPPVCFMPMPISEDYDSALSWFSKWEHNRNNIKKQLPILRKDIERTNHALNKFRKDVAVAVVELSVSNVQDETETNGEAVGTTGGSVRKAKKLAKKASLLLEKKVRGN